MLFRRQTWRGLAWMIVGMLKLQGSEAQTHDGGVSEVVMPIGEMGTYRLYRQEKTGQSGIEFHNLFLYLPQKSPISPQEKAIRHLQVRRLRCPKVDGFQFTKLADALRSVLLLLLGSWWPSMCQEQPAPGEAVSVSVW